MKKRWICNPPYKKKNKDISYKIRRRKYLKAKFIQKAEEKKYQLSLNKIENINSNDTFNILFNLNPLSTILSKFDDGTIIYANPTFFQNTGYLKKEIIGQSSVAIGLWADPKQREKIKKIISKKERLSLTPFQLRLKNGEKRKTLATSQLIECDRQLYLLSVIVDNEREKKIERELNEKKKEVELFSNKLLELNTAIRILGDAWGQEKVAIDNRLKKHLNINVYQFIEKIKSCRKISDIQTYIGIIDHNLKKLNLIISGTRHDVTQNFTPLENQVFQLVGQGKSSKEIAEILNLSTKAISFHRSNIRKKLNLVNKKINLTTYLRNHDLLV